MYTIEIKINELDNGHSKLTVHLPTGYVMDSEYPTLEEALDEGYKTLARERIKWRS